MFPVDAPPSVDCLLAVSQRCCDILDFPAFQSSVGYPTSSLLGSIHHVTLPRLCPNDTLRDTSGWIAQVPFLVSLILICLVAFPTAAAPAGVSRMKKHESSDFEEGAKS